MAVRLRKTLNRRVGKTAYYRWRIENVSPEDVAALGWNDGTELTGSIDRGKLTLARAK